jgi:hypothetical protein
LSIVEPVFANICEVCPDKSSSAHWWKSSSGKGQAAR